MYTTGIQGYIKFPWLSLSTSNKQSLFPFAKKILYHIMNFRMNLKIEGNLCVMDRPHQHNKVSRYKTCIFTSHSEYIYIHRNREENLKKLGGVKPRVVHRYNTNMGPFDILDRCLGF